MTLKNHFFRATYHYKQLTFEIQRSMYAHTYINVYNYVPRSPTPC